MCLIEIEVRRVDTYELIGLFKVIEYQVETFVDGNIISVAVPACTMLGDTYFMDDTADPSTYSIALVVGSVVSHKIPYDAEREYRSGQGLKYFVLYVKSRDVLMLEQSTAYRRVFLPASPMINDLTEVGIDRRAMAAIEKIAMNFNIGMMAATHRIRERIELGKISRRYEAEGRSRAIAQAEFQKAFKLGSLCGFPVIEKESE